MTDNIAAIAAMVKESEIHADGLSKDRIRAEQYYQGEMLDTPNDVGRSAMVTRDVRAAIKRVKPSIVRTILGNDEVGEFLPVGEGDEDGADQASDYINYIVLPECDGRRHIEDALDDAMLLRNGILKWWHEEKRAVKISSHSGLDESAFNELVAPDDVEIMEHSERQEDVEGQPTTVHDFKIKRVFTERKIRLAAVPRERFLIHPDAVTLEDSALTGEKTTITRSDLVAMGYDKDLIWGLPTETMDDSESDTRRDTSTQGSEVHRANEMVDYYDLYVRFDMDGDGIAELRNMCFAGGLTEKNLLVDVECDEVQYADIAVMRRPHQWEGVSIADDIMPTQKVKTVLLREVLDNIYWQNKPQPIVQSGVIENMDALLNPEFGLPIRVKQGFDVRTAVGFTQVPFVAQQAFDMMAYLDDEAQDLTGISDASAGLAPDALQNMTATASAMIEQAGIGQTELMVKTAAEGLKRVFRGLLRLVIRHQDMPRTVRLRDEWVQFDPRDWNADMDCTINTGLGAGTRERDMMMMQQVIMLQEKLLAGFGPDNPFVKPANLYNSTAELCKAAGLKTPNLYFTEPDEAEVQAKMEAMKNAPDPEQMKLQAQAQLEQAKSQMTMQLEQAKMQASTQKEAAQMQADLAVKQAERQTQVLLSEQELAFKREELAAKNRLEYTKLGLAQNEAGEPVDQKGDSMMQMMQQVSQMLAVMGQQMQMAQRPKRIVRDAMGEVVGLEPYDQLMN